MNSILPMSELLESDSSSAARGALKDELARMEAELRARMDQGLTPDEMAVARPVREAVQAARDIVDRLL